MKHVLGEFMKRKIKEKMLMNEIMKNLKWYQKLVVILHTRCIDKIINRIRTSLVNEMLKK